MIQNDSDPFVHAADTLYELLTVRTPNGWVDAKDRLKAYKKARENLRLGPVSQRIKRYTISIEHDPAHPREVGIAFDPGLDERIYEFDNPSQYVFYKLWEESESLLKEVVDRMEGDD